MRRLRITLAQVNTTVGDLDGNVALCLDAVERARARGSHLVVFPELTLAGYPPEDLLLKPGFLRECGSALERFVAGVPDDICAVVGFVDGTGPVHNASAVVSGGAVRTVYRKMNLPNYGVFDEKRYFTPGGRPESFVLNGVSVGLNICEDIWVDGGPYCSLFSDHHVELLLNISASPFHAGKLRERETLLRRRALDGDTAIAYVNLVGGQDEVVFDGGSLVYDREGRCLARAPLFREELATLDMEFSGAVHRTVLSSASVDVKPASASAPEAVMARELSIEEEILDALTTGTRDYIRKNGFGTVVIGLSGGVDSALVAAVAVRALGAENVVCVTMPSMYTTSGTRSDAEVLADNLGVRFMEIPIERVFEAFNGTLAPAFEGHEPDVTEENIQARIRGTLLMALSNKFGWLVLTTGNKSEMAVGYATLYGDMAGGFAVIKDVFKLMVYRVCRLINEQAGHDLIPASILTRPPSAELRPDQKDSDSLPDYDKLDSILRAYIEEDRGVDDIVALGYDRETVRRVVRLCDIAEYKRRQAPPGVKITPRAFGRDRRLPITNRFRP